MNGASGIVTGLVSGFVRTIQLDKSKIADIIPVDYTVNALISVMWDTVNRYIQGIPRGFTYLPIAIFTEIMEISKFW